MKRSLTPLILAVAILATAVLSAVAQPANAARPLELGVRDDARYVQDEAASRQLWLDRTVDTRANLVLLGVSWPSIAKSRPANPTNPADPAYDWAKVDAAVRDATSRGLRVIIMVTYAPGWAEGANRPSIVVAPPGTWLPDPGQLGQFGRAIATRYSGRYGNLPAVRRFQLWAEPNLAINLTPQRRGKRGVSPVHYRRMLNAFYPAVKAVDRRNVVVTGGLAPYGDKFRSTPLLRMQPIRFWRQFFCFKGPRLRPKKCKQPARFDVISHHPINEGRPTRKARNRDDASTPDIGKIKRILRKARKTGRVRPKGRKPFWATEIFWNSQPPKPNGIPLQKHARFVEQAFYLLWKQGVSVVVWFEIKDLALIPGFRVPQSGLFFEDGTVKPAYYAFRFPFVAERIKKGKRKGRVRVWGKAPRPGPVSIERAKGGGWRTVKKLKAPGNRIFVGSIRRGGLLRARSGSETSLSWKQR